MRRHLRWLPRWVVELWLVYTKDEPTRQLLLNELLKRTPT